MAHFVFVHGAYHGGWCWQRLSPLLEAQGHSVLTPDLPGHGTDATPYPDLSLDAYVDKIALIIGGHDQPITLVGHSMAGMVISGVAEVLPEALSRLVYLTAYLPKQTPQQQAESISDLMRLAPTPSARKRALVQVSGVDCITVEPDELGPYFYNDASDQDVEWVRPHLIPEPVAAFKTAVPLTQDRYGTVPRDYISCRLDRAIPADLQDVMLQRSPCRRAWSMETGHSPFLTAPEALAEILIEGEGAET